MNIAKFLRTEFLKTTGGYFCIILKVSYFAKAIFKGTLMHIWKSEDIASSLYENNMLKISH